MNSYYFWSKILFDPFRFKRLAISANSALCCAATTLSVVSRQIQADLNIFLFLQKRFGDSYMSKNPNNDYGRQSNSDAPSGEGSKAASDTGAQLAAEQGKQFVEFAREGADKLVDLREKAAETTQHLMQNSVERASQQAREAAERFSKTLGFSGQDGDRFALQSKQNIEAITRCGTVLNQAFQDASRTLFELGQKQFQRNIDGFNKLARATSVQEGMTIQSTLVREGLEGMIKGSKMLTETSSRAVDEASKTFANVSQAR